MFLVIIIYSLLMMTRGLKLPAKCFLLIIKLLCCIVQSLEIYIHLFGCSCKGQGLHKIHHVVKCKNLDVIFNIRRLEPSKVYSNPVILYLQSYVYCVLLEGLISA